MENIIRFEGFLNESMSDAEGKKYQTMLAQKVEKYKSQRKTCFSKQTCPSLWGITYGSIDGALFLVFTAGSILGAAEGWGLMLGLPTLYFGYRSFEELSAVEQKKILPELKSLYKCLGEDFFK